MSLVLRTLTHSELERRAYIENWPIYPSLISGPPSIVESYEFYKRKSEILKKRLELAVQEAVEASNLFDEMYSEEAKQEAISLLEKKLITKFPDEIDTLENKPSTEEEAVEIISKESVIDPIPQLLSEMKTGVLTPGAESNELTNPELLDVVLEGVEKEVPPLRPMQIDLKSESMKFTIPSTIPILKPMDVLRINSIT